MPEVDENKAETRQTGATVRFMEGLMRGFMPPDDLTVSEWAEKNRRLSLESSAEAGPWRNERTPYLREVMDSFSNPRVRHIVFVAASQVGKSEAELNILGYIMDEDPGSILFIHPVKDDAKDFSKLRIAPMIRDTPVLKRKVADPKQRDSANTILQKSYPGGILTLCGSTEAHALASKPIRYVLGDERDRWARTAGKEGDPWELAMRRQTTFYNAKAVEVSTPTIKGASVIDRAYNKGSMARWVSRCPHCGEYHEIRWADLRFEYQEREIRRERTVEVSDVWYLCPGCGAISDERSMKTAPAHWVHENEDAKARGELSFWLNAFVSPWLAWKSIVQSFLEARGDSLRMQVVYNTMFGETWENRGDTMDEEGMLSRREDYDAELPDGVLVLTCGIDTQDDRLEYEVVGHGHFGETWGIKAGIIMGKPNDPATWAELDEVLDRAWRFKDGVGMKISVSFMDEGGHYTQDVRIHCRERISKKLYAIKGAAGQDRPFTSPPKQQKIIIADGTYYGACWVYTVGVDAGKQMIMDSLRVMEPGPRYAHFPRRDDYGHAFFVGLLSETLVYHEDRKQPWGWEKIPGHERNERLDCRNYAMAAFKTLNTDLDARADEIRQAHETKAAGGKRTGKTAQLPAGRKKTLEMSGPPSEEKQSTKPERYYDKW